jgi:hypothetical protein
MARSALSGGRRAGGCYLSSTITQRAIENAGVEFIEGGVREKDGST